MKGIRFQAKTPDSTLVIFQQNVLAEGCEFDLGGAQADAQTISPQFDIREFAALRGIGEGTRGPLGCFVHGGNMQVVARSRVTKYFVFHKAAVIIRRSDAVFESLSATATTLSALDMSVLDHTATDEGHFGLMDGQQQVNGLITFETNSTSRRLTQLRLVGATGNAVQAYGGCFINVGAIEGGANGGYGINVFKMSKAVIDFGGTQTTVTGDTGETLIGNKPATYKSIHPNGASDTALNRIEV